jgi:transcription antitermination factor NusG
MYTGEEYKDMEVKITAGPLKGRTGTVKASRELNGQEMVYVAMGSRVVNPLPVFKIDNVVELL